MTGRSILYPTESKTGQPAASQLKPLWDVVALAAPTASPTLDITPFDKVGLQLVWLNGIAPAGEIRIQVSIDETNWSTLDLAPSVPTISGASGSHTFHLMQLPFGKLRVFWNRTAGSTDIKVYRIAKEL